MGNKYNRNIPKSTEKLQAPSLRDRIADLIDRLEEQSSDLKDKAAKLDAAGNALWELLGELDE